MAICDQCHVNISTQTKLLDGLDICPTKWRVCGRALNRFVHEGMNNIMNLKVNLRTCSGAVNIAKKLCV